MSGELIGIQYLRGIAALMVVIFHVEPQLKKMGYDGPWLPGLSSGVDIFFVISGFIMFVTTHGKAMTPWVFWRRRIIRIVPLYWLFTAFTVFVMLAVPGVMQTSRFDLAHVVSSFLFIAWPHPVQPSMDPLVIPGWTLNYEMFFYLLFGLFLLAPERWRLPGMASALAALIVLGALLSFEAVSIGGFYTSSIMLEFAFGMAIAALAMRRNGLNRIPASVAAVLMAAGFVAILGLPFGQTGLPRAVVSGIPAAVIVASAIILELHGRLSRLSPLLLMGDASYSIYLSHVVVLSAVSQAWRKLGLTALPGSELLFSAMAVLACLAAGIVCFKLVETPLLKLFRRRRSGAVVQGA